MPTVEDILGNQPPPVATVTQAGRWWHEIDITHMHLSVYQGGRFGRRWAQRVAQRKLDKYVSKRARRKQWRAEAVKIRAD